MILHKGELLFRQGEEGPLYFVKTGLLKVVRLQEDGTPFLFNIIVPGETIPHHSLISPKEYHGTAIALMKTEIEPIMSQEWYDKLRKNPELYANVALQLQTKLRMMQQRIDQLTTVSPRERLHRLQQWFSLYLGGIPIYEILTQTEIGQLIGVRRETVNRLLRDQIKNEVK
ncbi:Crp/Fnr family transcriptional regulator [Bacillus cytotoxicus]|uniref:Cyclic nucleotide-binding protein n=2 Tax=Bacillus cytotoxicus TaxID=580165 RepID=A0AAX2CF77_9BACI|nr:MULTISPECIES: Crp/Fnr family transcriptional regulator [Bacillus cereus group]ABS21497.1 cyclic nucleotide-binding protein [Bacillus cytotoxicus NVH 391-98]AWC28141.1 Crp/Fnr family transcriptional regulator [Bacillus cytotoxicus]AWC32169.1 Crp/Fnr family transcriptional regulator [Bacillus cytotoxicus]AWC36197.1 Crp/Fnr family transcriptional regulator [Bacillus cytotoxicus]AWC40476.1 Crp/Fnr family transcriptional regulator [Bacillus cytotoxicus]